jgi:hypothetical protein
MRKRPAKLILFAIVAAPIGVAYGIGGLGTREADAVQRSTTHVRPATRVGTTAIRGPSLAVAPLPSQP